MSKAGTDSSEELKAEDWAGEMGDRWLANLDRFESMIAPIGAALLERAAYQTGERVLDVGRIDRTGNIQEDELAPFAARNDIPRLTTYDGDRVLTRSGVFRSTTVPAQDQRRAARGDFHSVSIFAKAGRTAGYEDERSVRLGIDPHGPEARTPTAKVEADRLGVEVPKPLRRQEPVGRSGTRGQQQRRRSKEEKCRQTVSKHMVTPSKRSIQ